MEVIKSELKRSLENALEDGKQVLMVGDFKARTGEEMIGVGDQEEQRSSEDKTINQEGRKLIELCERNGLKILNGMVDGDRPGKFTSVNSRGAAVVDYLIIKDSGMVKRMNIASRTDSDHLPLGWAIRSECVVSLLNLRYKFF
uniref:Endonuclease/exonuclease/phosphatase domain-containing protein n=1 Tax=Strigamia maritima TaxID=126957 RepID=T1IQ86_STRMM